ncbi:MAG: 2-C-methyl-D-erythritol 4-phosphate cytidylyltransferase [Deltaproteobacteria bacterium]|nr:2-C-methyl-D-erythritol 4-phosphate cytidylyltransferase [Deltaproteobacteria bacterium]
MKTVAIIPSAGKGLRLGLGKKPWVSVLGRPMLAHTLTAFEKCPVIGAVVVVSMSSDAGRIRKNIIKKYGFKKVASVVAGGKERQDSVRRGLDAAAAIDGKWDMVVVHDCARPLVTPKLINDTVMAAIKKGSAIAAVPLKDTVKEISGGTVKRTIPRDTLRAVQTPQAFKLPILKKAYETAGKDGFRATDCSSLVERLGKKIAVVEGSYENIKITTQEDLAFAENILRRRSAKWRRGI